jgi:hypothetical protein
LGVCFHDLGSFRLTINTLELENWILIPGW